MSLQMMKEYPNYVYVLADDERIYEVNQCSRG